MSDILPFTVDGPVRFFKILNHDEKIELVKRRILQEKELTFRVMAFYNSNKHVIGYDIDDDGSSDENS